MHSPALLERRLLDALADGPLPARELIAHARGASQPTVSRALNRLGDRVIKLGAARATSYAAGREIRGLGASWALYRIDAHGRAQAVGRLQALMARGFHLDPEPSSPTGLHRALPPRLADLRPQGFAGREFAQRHAAELQADVTPERWSDETVLQALLQFGDDLPGDLVIGDAMLERVQRRALETPQPIARDDRAAHYADRAEQVLRGDAVTWLAGHQPKFGACIVDAEGAPRHVLVKFSEAINTPSKRRWVDLLVCEHLALETLRAAGLDAAASELVIAGERIALEVTRFDRVGAFGRAGVSSLSVFDRGHDRWLDAADRLQDVALIEPADANQLRLWFWFGTLIGNSDMHFANAALLRRDGGNLQLAPCYDMLPMGYRPSTNGEVIEREFTTQLPMPRHVDIWRIAATLATRFWTAASEDKRISPPFRQIAAANRDAVLKARALIG